MEESFKKLWIESPTWGANKLIKVDDFLVAIGKKRSNSVYHVAEVTKTQTRGRMIRQHLKVLKSDLPTALRRDPDQTLVAFTWNYRK